jgi:uncharacterized repeat protein (TIGR01451 family)/fimbrial isopeptide formation D2 family protein
MIASDAIGVRAGKCRIGILLFTLALSLLAAAPTRAEDCSDYPGGVLDGFAGTVAPSQLNIDQNCTIRNYPNGMSTNISFFTQPGQQDERWLVIFDNVVHTGQMSCNAVQGHKIWFVNGSSSGIHANCQNLFIPVEKIEKQNPAGQTTAAIGVPFTYRLVIPVLFDPLTGTVIDYEGSANDLHGITVWDDLGATGVDLTYLSHSAYWLDSGTPIPHSFSNAGGALTFDLFPIVPAGDQFVIEITVVLEDTPANAPGTQFVNTARWDFGRLIDGVFYEPLPGEWGISPPLTIAAPQLVLAKTGPATLGRTLNLGEWGEFALDVHNTGLADAWDVTILDRLPDGATGGMCDATPQVLSAQVFAADGVTPIPGKGPLSQGTDFSLAYSAAPTCELTLSLLTAAGAIGPNERLILRYRTQLDSDSQNGAALTNVAGATQWFNADSSQPDRVSYTRALTDGSVGTPDHEDAHTVTVVLFGYFFEKTVGNLTTGVSPTQTAAPGDSVRYTLRLQTTDGALDDVAFRDDLGALNPSAVFVPGSLALVAATIPAGADVSFSDPNGGTNGAGILDIRHLSLPAFSQLAVQFDLALDPTVADGTVVTNQAELLGSFKLADSDDPTVNGQADPSILGDEDPTRFVIEAAPGPVLLKANTQSVASIGEEFRYRITVPATPHTAALYDVRILDDLNASAADLQFVAVEKISGSGAWTPTNTGSGTNLVIEDPANGIDIPAGEQVVVEITVRLLDTSTNVAGLTFTNTAAYTYQILDGDEVSERPGEAGTTEPMTVAEPVLTLEKSGPAAMSVGAPGAFTLDVHNAGDATAWNATLTDRLPNGASGGSCDVPPSQLSARIFESDGVTPVSAALVEGTDFTVAFTGDPGCTFTLALLSAAAAIAPDQRLIFGYEIQLDADTQTGAALTNVAGATEWFSAASTSTVRRTSARTLTDGTPGVLDHEDAHTVTVAPRAYLFEKTVANLTRGTDPATIASPGDRLRYRLRLENLGDDPLANLAFTDELDRLNAPAAFAPASLALISVPVGADASLTSATGGAQGTGLLDVRNLDLPGGAGESLVIEFEITLAPVIANGTSVANQSQLLLGGSLFAQSDDPNVNGPADPLVSGDEDPTRVLIEAAPAFRVEKVSTDLSGDPNQLLAGETLRYTITVQNIGNANAVDVVLRDAVPANTSYVAGSTTLNGAAVADGPSGSSPLVAGIPIHAPEDPTPGAMRADASGTTSNVATITFDVVVDAGVTNGTVISNQGFVSTLDGVVTDRPSDDPGTVAPDDPTLDVVGDAPLLFAAKSATLLVDGGTPGVVDPADVLRYTIVVTNSGAVDATGASLSDSVPANTSYVADSLTLNGLPVGRPDGGSSPLVAGIPISSADRTPPLPGPGAGTLSPGGTAVVAFDLRVDDGVPGGTLISNQASVRSDALPDLPTDGDGDPSTGPEPTVVVVGAAQQLSIAKQVAVVGGGAALPGAQVEYVVRIVNASLVPAFGVVITDDLDAVTPGRLAYVTGSATLNGSPAGVSVVGSILTADVAAVLGPLAPSASATLRFRAIIDPGATTGATVTNTGVVAWGTPPETASASVSFDVGGTPGLAMLGGTVWHDADFDRLVGIAERVLVGWVVDLLRDGQPLQSVSTDASGRYSIGGLAPSGDSPTDRYELRFRAPDAGAGTASLGRADSPFTNGPQRITEILVASGANLQNLNLPIDPDGVVYDAIGRAPISGATLSMLSAGGGTQLPATCFDDAAQQNQVTRSDGYYKFDLNFSDPACPSGGSYLLAVVPPGSGYVAGTSQRIPPTSGPATPPLAVPLCPGTADDALPSPPGYCEAQPSEFAPPTSVAAGSAGTRYHVHLTLDGSQTPGTSQIFNNHIPLDPVLDGAVALSKTTPMVNVSRGQLVPYEIRFSHELGIDLQELSIVDSFPAGFSYVEGSAQIDGVPHEPTIVGNQLIWTDLGAGSTSQRSLRLLLAVGAGVSEGEFVNRAQAVSVLNGSALSSEASATVRVVPDPTFSCTDVIGKVFDDANRNGIQDPGERGLAGVRLVTARGLAAATDAFGRYHITCAATPNEVRGSNFVLKLDDRTLPSGFRLSTRQVQVQRASAGKAIRFNYAASIHRVVALDLADAVFEPGSTSMRAQWKPRLELLIRELRKAPATLRLSYVADVEEAGLVDRRLVAVERAIADAWRALDMYALDIEREVYWRRGAPPDRSGLRMQEGR